jgi:hypothetical protein
LKGLRWAPSKIRDLQVFLGSQLGDFSTENLL